jgi:hypothetical protein
MIETVLSEIHLLEDIMIHSDKCGPKELQKIDDEFEKDLQGKRKPKFKTKIWQFIKDDNSMQK